MWVVFVKKKIRKKEKDLKNNKRVLYAGRRRLAGRGEEAGRLTKIQDRKREKCGREGKNAHCERTSGATEQCGQARGKGQEQSRKNVWPQAQRDAATGRSERRHLEPVRAASAHARARATTTARRSA